MTINCKGKLLDLSSPVVMGILNLTPDSFFDGGKYTTEDSYLQHTETMLQDGATIIDIGGMSSRPGAAIIAAEEEMDRILTPIANIRNRFPEAILSVDTLHSQTAKAAIAAGAHIINDISAGEYDADMIPTVATLQVPYIAMHMRGIPQTMQQQTDYNNVVTEVYQFLFNKVTECHSSGINDVIIDVGFGFSKTLAQNYELMRHLNYFTQIGVPILTGISGKSMLTKLLNIDKTKTLNASTALNMIALQKGSNILRVHDVKAAVECIKIYNAIKIS